MMTGNLSEWPVPVGRVPMADRLDPDELARLEDERNFLLRSLDDLDAERGVGDVDDADYQSLHNDYTRRAAEVVRSIDNQRAAHRRAKGSTPTAQRVATVVAVVVLAVLAGVLLARSVGFRSPSGTATGGIRQSSVGLLAEADTLTREGAWPEAIDIYDEVLANSPANTEALTYRGWLTARLGDPDAGLDDITEAIAVDPDYPDARVFAAILLDDAQQFDDAAAQLAVLDGLAAPPQVAGLVDASGLRTSVTAGQIAQRFGDGTAIDLGQVSGTLDDAAQAAFVLDELDPLLGLRTFDAVIEADPSNVIALVGKGRRLGADPDIAQTSPETAAAGLALLDQAVDAAPESAEVRLYRALARVVQGQSGPADEDLNLIDRTLLDDELGALYDQVAEVVASR